MLSSSPLSPHHTHTSTHTLTHTHTINPNGYFRRLTVNIILCQIIAYKASTYLVQLTKRTTLKEDVIMLILLCFSNSLPTYTLLPCDSCRSWIQPYKVTHCWIFGWVSNSSKTVWRWRDEPKTMYIHFRGRSLGKALCSWGERERKREITLCTSHTL